MSTPARTSPFAAGFMDDYFAEADEHIVAVRRSLLTLEAALGSESAVGRARGAVPKLPFAEGHLGDGRAA